MISIPTAQDQRQFSKYFLGKKVGVTLILKIIFIKLSNTDASVLKHRSDH